MCGADVINTEGSTFKYHVDNWCIASCTPAQCGQTIDAVSPKGERWGVKLACPPC
jgi:hypothetical protein